MFAIERVERYGNIGAGSNPPKPSLSGPSRKQLRRLVSRDAQRAGSILYLYDFVSRLENSGQPESTTRDVLLVGRSHRQNSQFLRIRSIVM